MADTWTAISGYSATDYVDTMTFEVDAETKKLAKLSGQTLVAGEKNSQYIQIRMPRYWDGIDISEMNISIIYDLNNSEYFGTTQAISAERTTDSIRFGWVVPEEACAVKGTLLFVIVVKGTNYILKTQIADTPVVKSLSEDGGIPEPTKKTWYNDFQVRVERTLSSAENAVEEAQTVLAQARSFIGSPLVAETAAGMVDTDRIYVYTGSETGYTTGNWYYYNTGTSAWTSGGVYNAVEVDTDTTLTIAGKPADSKKTGDEISQIKENISDMNTATSADVGKALKVKTVTNGKVTGWEFGEAGGADPDAIGQAVEDWLDAHPEATTTVPDKSLTINKMVTGTLGYVTPEMYGAVGDGTTNDTSAFSQACNSGKPVVLTEGKTYKIDTVTVTSPLIIIGNLATVSTTSSDSVKSTITIRENAKTVVIGDVNFTTTLGVDTTGAHGEAIPNRSLRTCIASYGVDKLSVINCTFENFDNGIIGITQSSDTVYASVPESLFVKDTKITNCLMGISRHYKNVVIDGCRIQVDTNAQSGEHCVYLLSDVLSNAYITNTTLITDGSSAGACVNIRPRNGEAGANLVDGAYRIDGCTMIGDGYVHVHGGGKCYVTSCTLKTVNYNTTAKIRQFACPSSDDSVIDVSGCSVNLELQDGLTERVIYRGCDIYSGRVFNTRFALYKAYNCQFDNIGINVAEGAEIVGCVFSSTSGVAGNYYVLVGSTVTASTIIGCTFKTGTNVNMIAYNSSGVCLLVAVISSLPNGNNITGLTFYHKINPNESEGSGTDGFSPVVTVTNITGGHRVTITDALGDNTFDVMDGTSGSGYSPWADKKICVFGDSIGYGYNNNAHSFVDILSERGFFASVHKNCVSGSTTATWAARLQESSTEIADADIIYAEYEANDIVGLKAGSLTTEALVSTVRNCTSAIRNVNPTCTIIWMPLTIQHLSKIAGTDLSYYQSWVNAMYPVFAELGINLLPIFDTLNANHASSDGRHPNDAGHEAIADLVIQMPLGTSNYPTAIS